MRNLKEKALFSFFFFISLFFVPIDRVVLFFCLLSPVPENRSSRVSFTLSSFILTRNFLFSPFESRAYSDIESLSRLKSRPSQTQPQPQPHTRSSSSSSSLPQPPFLQTPQLSVPNPATNTNHTSDKMDGSAVPMQDTKSAAEATVPGAGAGAGAGGNTLAAASSSTAANAGTPQVRAGGAPVRVFMNEKIAPYLLEGMKVVVRDQYVISSTTAPRFGVSIERLERLSQYLRLGSIVDRSRLVTDTSTL